MYLLDIHLLIPGILFQNYLNNFFFFYSIFFGCIRRDRDREGSYYEDDHVEGGSAADDGTNNSRSRKVSSEFSPSVTQNLEYWGSNLLDLFGDNSRKGSSSNLQPLGTI